MELGNNLLLLFQSKSRKASERDRASSQGKPADAETSGEGGANVQGVKLD